MTKKRNDKADRQTKQLKSMTAQKARTLARKADLRRTYKTYKKEQTNMTENENTLITTAFNILKKDYDLISEQCTEKDGIIKIQQRRLEEMNEIIACRTTDVMELEKKIDGLYKELAEESQRAKNAESVVNGMKNYMKLLEHEAVHKADC